MSDIEFARMWMFGRGVTVVRKPELATGRRSWFLNGVLPDNMKDLYSTRWKETYGCTTIEGYESELDAVTHIARRLKSFKDSLSYCNVQPPPDPSVVPALLAALKSAASWFGELGNDDGAQGLLEEILAALALAEGR